MTALQVYLQKISVVVRLTIVLLQTVRRKQICVLALELQDQFYGYWCEHYPKLGGNERQL